MKAVLVAVAAIGFVSIAGSIWIAQRNAEPTVVSDPYEEGLHYDEHRHASDPTGGKRTPPQDPCDLAAGPCTRPLPGGASVTLAVAPRPPRAMADLDLSVRVSPPAAADGASVTVAFTMPRMAMGELRAALAPAGDGAFRGKGVVVRCPSGRRDWSAEVRVERPGAPARTARFPLTVAAE